MPQTFAIPEKQQFVLDGMSWRSYERALRTFDGRRVRINFSRGVLEILTLSPEHERLKYLLARMVDVLVEELGWDSANFGSMTFKQRPKGMEPDECFWIAHELDVRGRDTLDPATDPPPDLVLEIEVSRSVVNRLAILAAMGATEVWRYDGQHLRAMLLGTDRKFHSSPTSRSFPFLPLDEVVDFLNQRTTQSNTAILRSFRTWVRDQIAHAWPKEQLARPQA